MIKDAGNKLRRCAHEGHEDQDASCGSNGETHDQPRWEEPGKIPGRRGHHRRGNTLKPAVTPGARAGPQGLAGSYLAKIAKQGLPDSESLHPETDILNKSRELRPLASGQPGPVLTLGYSRGCGIRHPCPLAQVGKTTWSGGGAGEQRMRDRPFDDARHRPQPCTVNELSLRIERSFQRRPFGGMPQGGL